jgi:hypothetical protein
MSDLSDKSVTVTVKCMHTFKVYACIHFSCTGIISLSAPGVPHSSCHIVFAKLDLNKSRFMPTP